jgi:hypothetical protein
MGRTGNGVARKQQWDVQGTGYPAGWVFKSPNGKEDRFPGPMNDVRQLDIFKRQLESSREWHPPK